MTDHGLPETECTLAWRAQVQYHQNRAAHRVLSEHHLKLAASADLVATMPDAEPPQSSALQHTGWLMRESYREAG